ncbi:MAG: hypothetical protein JXA54_00065 [Candidatus Heimdallarchaeota archaeon]|nr:hypothetical protein [Candidatus Heimdallarchaeota archaeon]
MENSQMISKTALDERGKKLGKIIRLDETPTGTPEVKDYYAIIHVKRFLGSYKFPLPLETYQPLSDSDTTITFAITKQEFKLIVDQHLATIKLKTKESKFGKVKGTDRAMAISYRRKF